MYSLRDKSVSRCRWSGSDLGLHRVLNIRVVKQILDAKEDLLDGDDWAPILLHHGGKGRRSSGLGGSP